MIDSSEYSENLTLKATNRTAEQLASLAARLPTLEQVRAEKARRVRTSDSLLKFVRFMKPDYVPSWHHTLLAEHLDKVARGEIQRLLISMPPRHGKSELCSRQLPPYLFGRQPTSQIISASYTATLANRMSRDVQRIMDSEPYKLTFADSRIAQRGDRDAKRTEAEFEIKITNQYLQKRAGTYRAVGVGGGITGHGADYIIIDDPIKNRAEAMSMTYRSRVWDWYTNDLYTRLEHSDSAIILIMTRWHEDDLAGRILSYASREGARGEEWSVLNLPALAEQDTPTELDPRTRDEALWPEKFPVQRLESIRSPSGIGPISFNGLFQGRPSSQSGTIFKLNTFKFWYDPNQFNGSGPPPPHTSKLEDGSVFVHPQISLPENLFKKSQSWDCSFKSTKISSFVCGQVWACDNVNFFLLDQIKDRMTFLETLRAVLQCTAKHPDARAKLIEDKANGAAVMDVLKSKISGIKPINPRGSKEERAHSVTPLYDGGNVYYPHPAQCSWVLETIASHIAFPAGRYNDDVDAGTQALDYLCDHSSHPTNIDISLHELTSESQWDI